MEKEKIIFKNNIIDLAQPRLGSKIVYCTDDFFAKASRIISPNPPVFIPNKFDQNGKWMDGWESRRKRTKGNDYLVLKLGRAGKIRKVLVDTSHFSGNQPDKISILATNDVNFKQARWINLVNPIKVKPNAKHYYSIKSNQTFKFIKLNIFPDGGVARLKVFGEIDTQLLNINKKKIINLASLENGSSIFACNNEHFGQSENILAKGKAKNMGDGWETRRRRGAAEGHDWIIIKCLQGSVKQFEISTHHFKGNYPNQFSLEGIHCKVSSKKISKILLNPKNWSNLISKSYLKAHQVHKFVLKKKLIINYLKLNIYPDGGVSRIKVLGTHQ
jgi:allantoicase